MEAEFMRLDVWQFAKKTNIATAAKKRCIMIEKFKA
jgi:hypothetical protein